MNRAIDRINEGLKRFLVGLIKLYRLILSPWIGRSCRFEPTCSRYTEEAIERFGPIKGTWMGVKRIGRCHPWHKAGMIRCQRAEPHLLSPTLE